MKPFIEQARFYAEYHRSKMTQYTHMVGIPLIILSLMIFFGFFILGIPGVFVTNLAVIGTIVALVYYFRLEWRLALALTPFLIILLWIAHFFSHHGPTKLGLWSFFVTFIVGWGFQLYGHFMEGKRPAFMDNVQHAFVAPLFLVAELLFMAGLMQGLQAEMGKKRKGKRSDNP